MRVILKFPQPFLDIISLLKQKPERMPNRNKLLGKTQNLIEQRLRPLNTRQLLNMLACHRTSVQTCLEYDEETRKTIGDSSWDYRGQLAILEEYAIRKVLATRPHVRRKNEGKQHRKKMATMHHGKKRKKA